MSADGAATALFLGAFFDELVRWGVRDVVVSPGSRSTPLAMTAYELSRRYPNKLRLFVNVDERGAAFFALGMAKASGRPAALICTSGTAVANYYPAVLEAESSRVPLVVLTGDRPAQLQGLGAPQTCDQLNAYGNHVRRFWQMPLPTSDNAALAFARQMAREACIHAAAQQQTEGMPSSTWVAGSCNGGVVHLNFPFEEPLKPDFSVEGLFEGGAQALISAQDSRQAAGACSEESFCEEETLCDEEPFRSEEPFTHARVLGAITASDVDRLRTLLQGRRTLILAGEGSVRTLDEARELVRWAQAAQLPLLADPLSGLRCLDDEMVIDNYDTVLAAKPVALGLEPQVVVRFGRYPVSKRATTFVTKAQPIQVVVDCFETRDFNAQTHCFVSCSPVDFVRSMAEEDLQSEKQQTFAQAWAQANGAAREHIVAAQQVEAGFEGAFVQRVIEVAPEGSCVFAANSMSIRTLDTFYLKREKHLLVLCNRGLNGIDGTLSTAFGAAQYGEQTTLLTGDLTMIHDLNALALQRELRFQSQQTGKRAASIVVVLLNNNGGAIFETLPQKSDDDYFERLFLTPQDVDFSAAAQAFDVPYRLASTLPVFDRVYGELLGTPGISLIEVRVPLAGLQERYAPYWSPQKFPNQK